MTWLIYVWVLWRVSFHSMTPDPWVPALGWNANLRGSRWLHENELFLIFFIILVVLLSALSWCPRGTWGKTVKFNPYTIKNPKNSDTRKICCNYPKSWTVWFYDRVMRPKDADGMANSVDPDLMSSKSSLIWVYTVCLDLQNAASD